MPWNYCLGQRREGLGMWRDKAMGGGDSNDCKSQGRPEIADWFGATTRAKAQWVGLDLWG